MTTWMYVNVQDEETDKDRVACVHQVLASELVLVEMSVVHFRPRPGGKVYMTVLSCTLIWESFIKLMGLSEMWAVICQLFQQWHAE